MDTNDGSKAGEGSKTVLLLDDGTRVEGTFVAGGPVGNVLITKPATPAQGPMDGPRDARVNDRAYNHLADLAAGLPDDSAIEVDFGDGELGTPKEGAADKLTFADGTHVEGKLVFGNDGKGALTTAEGTRINVWPSDNRGRPTNEDGE